MHLWFLINFTQLTRVARCPAVINITATSLFLKSRPTWGKIVFLNIFLLLQLTKVSHFIIAPIYNVLFLSMLFKYFFYGQDHIDQIGWLVDALLWSRDLWKRIVVIAQKSLRSKELIFLNYFVSRLDEERRWKFAYFWRNYMARGGEWRRRRRIISRRRIKWRRRVERNELKARQKAALKSGKYSLYLAKDRGRRWLLEPISSLRIRNSRTRVVLSLTHKRLVGQWLMRLRCRFNRDIGPWRNMNT